MAAYINGISVISPQKTFLSRGFPAEVMAYEDVQYLKCVEPLYRDFLDPMAARRMSRIVKMGVCSAKACLHESGIDMPDAIITGTGLGCIEDTEKFLSAIYTNEEKLLNPTPFIQSTHNTVAASIALAIRCQNYNITYTQRGFSFETAMQDAMMQLDGDPSLNILVGGLDELTSNSYAITRRLGLWKSRPISNMSIGQSKDRGSLPGEGIAFFLLGGSQKASTYAKLMSMKTFFTLDDQNDIEKQIGDFIIQNELHQQDIDLVLIGINGDSSTDGIYKNLNKGIFCRSSQAYFKHLCGEYDTAPAFALWLASVLLKEQQVPEAVIFNKIPVKNLNNILVYNHLRGMYHVLYLVSRC
jgi:hypothetical protein